MNKLLYIMLLSSYLISQTLRGGVISDGLDLANIKIAKHLEYTRVVFFANFWEGHKRADSVADNSGGYKFILSDDKMSVDIELLGYRSATLKSIIIVDTIKSIKALKGEEYGDDSSLFYRVNLLNRASRIEGFTLSNPARVVLDIYM